MKANIVPKFFFDRFYGALRCRRATAPAAQGSSLSNMATPISPKAPPKTEKVEAFCPFHV
jgi:hypothetical protein